MKAVFALISRNRKLFFKDRGMFFSALITPGILILLYATFLANVYRDSFVSAIPDMITISDKLIDGTVAAQLAAALLAVSCVTVTFCVNLTMVQDRANGTRKDFNVSPISKAQLYLGYFLSTVVNSLLVNGLALVLCLGYMYKMGWYMSAVDVIWVLLDEILLVLFGSTLSSIVSFPLTTQGQLSAVGTIVSAGYGFLCGAYMPISNFGSGLQKVLSYLPSTYGTSLLKNHMLRGIFEEMENNQLPEEMITAIRDTLDCNPKFHGSVVSVNQMVMLMVGFSFAVCYLCPCFAYGWMCCGIWNYFFVHDSSSGERWEIIAELRNTGTEGDERIYGTFEKNHRGQFPGCIQPAPGQRAGIICFPSRPKSGTGIRLPGSVSAIWNL